MNVRYPLFLAVCLLLLLPAARAEEVELRWQLEPGETFHYDHLVTERVMYTVRGEARQVARSSELRSRIRFRVLELRPSGSARLRMSWERVQGTIYPAHGEPLQFDSDQQQDLSEELEQRLGLIAHLGGQSLELTLTPTGQVEDLSGVERLLEQLPETSLSGELEEVMAAATDPAAVRRSLQAQLADLFSVVPPKNPVQYGSSWERDSWPFGWIALPVTVRYRLVQLQPLGDRQLYRLSLQNAPRAETKPEDGPEVGELQVRAAGVPRIENAAVLWDPKNGRTESSTRDYRLNFFVEMPGETPVIHSVMRQVQWVVVVVEPEESK